MYVRLLLILALVATVTVATDDEPPMKEKSSSTVPYACVYGEPLDIYTGYSYLTSPFYPSYYDDNMACYWQLRSHNGYYVKATVLDMSLSDDRLTFYDGFDMNYPILASYSGYDYAVPLVSSGDRMFVEFKSNDEYTSRGFQVKYEATMMQTEVSACADGHWIADHYSYTSLTSPNYPNQYYNDLNCMWHIYNDYCGCSEGIVELRVEDLFLNSGDEVLIYDGDSGTLLALFTYSNYHSPIYSTSNHMKVVFSTDSSHVDRGFHFSVIGSLDAMPPPPSAVNCDNQIGLRSGTGNITSPFYPDHYDNDMICSITIQASYPYRVKLTVVDLLLVSYDTLSVYDGYSDPDNLLASYSGHWSNESLTSNSYSLFLQFKSDSHYTNRGFQLQYNTVANCSETHYLTSIHATVYSSNYGNGYYPYLSECWFFADYHNELHLTFHSMDTEPYYDQLTLYSHDTYLKHWEGSYSDAFYENIYMSNCYDNCGFWMAFVTDGSVSYPGFSFTYSLN